MTVQGKNRHYRWQEIQGRHWLDTARRCDFGNLRAVMDEVFAKTPNVIQQVRGLIPQGFRPQIADAILNGLKASTDQWKAD